MAAGGGWRELGDGVLVRRHKSFDLNVGLVLGTERCLVIDTRESLVAGRELATAVREVTDLPWTIVITHAHSDHWLGTAAFDGAEVWTLDRCATDIADSGEEQRTNMSAYLAGGGKADSAERAAQMAASPIVVPDQTFSGPSAELELGGRTVTLHDLGRGHSVGDVVITVEGSDVVFAGDLVEEGAPPQFGDAYPLEWGPTLDALLALGRPVVVPGHGDVVDAAFTAEQRDLHRRVVEAAAAGASAVPGLPDAFAAPALERARRQLNGEPPDPPDSQSER